MYREIAPEKHPIATLRGQWIESSSVFQTPNPRKATAEKPGKNADRGPIVAEFLRNSNPAVSEKLLYS
jgi:hypothetical protein